MLSIDVWQVTEGAVRAHCDRAFARLREAAAVHIRGTHTRLFDGADASDAAEKRPAAGGATGGEAVSVQFAVQAMEHFVGEIGVATRGVMPLLRAGTELLPDMVPVLRAAVRGQLSSFLQVRCCVSTACRGVHVVLSLRRQARVCLPRNASIVSVC